MHFFVLSMWSNHIHLNIKKSITKCVFKYYLTQVYSESQRLYMFLMPSYLQLSFQLPPITSVLALLFIHNFFFLFPPLSPSFTYLSLTSLLHLLCCLSLWHCFLPLFFHFCFSPCHLSFILLSLTNIPSISCSAPVIPRLLNPCPSSAANPFPPM